MSRKQTLNMTSALHTYIQHGGTITAAARKHGVTQQGLSNVLKKAGFPPGKSGKPRKYPLSIVNAAIETLLQNGGTIEGACDRHHISISTLKRALTSSGVVCVPKWVRV